MTALIVLVVIGYIVFTVLALKIGVCKWGWHPRPFDMAEEYQGFNARQRCRKCGYVGLVDSNGDLF